MRFLRSRNASRASGDRDRFSGIHIRRPEEERPREEVRSLQVSPFDGIKNALPKRTRNEASSVPPIIVAFGWVGVRDEEIAQDIIRDSQFLHGLARSNVDKAIYAVA